MPDAFVNDVLGTWTDAPASFHLALASDVLGTWTDSPATRINARATDALGTWTDGPVALAGPAFAIVSDVVGRWVDAPKAQLPAAVSDVLGTWTDAPVAQIDSDAFASDTIGRWTDTPVVITTGTAAVNDTVGRWTDSPKAVLVAAAVDAIGTWTDSPAATPRLFAIASDTIGTWTDAPAGVISARALDVLGTWTDAPAALPAGVVAAVQDLLGRWRDAPLATLQPGAVYDTPYATAYIVNTDTGAITTADWPLTGLAAAGGLLLAVGDEGLLAVDAETDNGTAIVWRVRTGRAPLGTNIGRVDSVMVHLEGGENVILKALSDGRAGLIEDWYDVVRYGTNADQQAKAKVGKGRVGFRWGFELAGKGETRLAQGQVFPVEHSKRR